MHTESMALMRDLLKRFVKPKPIQRKVLDVGGADLNGSYRKLFPAQSWQYETLDFSPSADHTVTNYEWSIPDEVFDLVISGQTLEHDPCFWLTIANMRRVVKQNGLIFIIVPSRGRIHRYPVDCYRFYPDSMHEMGKWAHLEVLGVIHQPRTHWGDLAAAFRRPRQEKEQDDPATDHHGHAR